MKSKDITILLDNFAQQISGRTRSKALEENRCVICWELCNEFKDELSAQEYRISAMCQKHQDEFYGSI